MKLTAFTKSSTAYEIHAFAMHAFEHSTRTLIFKLEETSVSSTVHVRWHDDVGGRRC